MKKFTLPLLLVATAMSSCLKDEVTDVYVTSDDPDVIALDLSSASTKGSELTANLLRTGYDENAGINITMYYDDGTHNGSIEFDYAGTGSGWLQTQLEPMKWSALNMPVTFYSMISSAYGGAATNYTLTYTTDYTLNSATLPSEFKVQETNIVKHEDLIMATTTVSKAPAGGTFNTVYDHALSKADVRIQTQDPASVTDLGNSVIILKADFRNLVNTGKPSITAATDAISWDISTTKYEEPLNYASYRAVDYNLTNQTYLAKHPASTYTPDEVLENYKAKTDGMSFSPNTYNLTQSSLISDYTTATTQADWYMLPIPQTILAGSETIDDFNTVGADNYVPPGEWEYVEDNGAGGDIDTYLDKAGIAYIDVIYRMDAYTDLLGNTKRFVGWEDAGDYYTEYVGETEVDDFKNWTDDQLNTLLAKYGSTNVIDTNGYTVDNAKADLVVYANAASTAWLAKYDDTPLYIRVGFGLPEDYDLVQGNYYQFLLDFANHGGYFLDDYYYDMNGNRTTIPLPDEYLPGEPVINKDAVISMTILVNAWNDAIDKDLDGAYEGVSPDGEGQVNDTTGGM